MYCKYEEEEKSLNLVKLFGQKVKVQLQVLFYLCKNKKEPMKHTDYVI